MSFLKKCVVAAVFAAMLAVAVAGGVYYWANRPMTLSPAELDVTIKPHSSLRSVSAQLIRGGVPVEPELSC